MRVTVADCLDLDAFRGAEVVAGKINLTNDVKAVSVLDACDSADLKFYKPDKTPNERDELIATEVKAKLTSEDYDSLASAIEHSGKDEDRLARTIDYCRKKLRYQNDSKYSEEVTRFLIKPENNYKIIYCAAGISSRTAIDKGITLSIDGEELKISDGQAIFFIHGKKLMDLVHKVYERCIQ